MNYESLRKDKMLALKEKDSLKNKVLTNVLSEVMYQAKEVGRDLEEAEIIAVFKKLVKQGQESLSLAKDRVDKAAEIEKELALLRSYLPEMLSKEALKEKVASIAEANQITKEPSNKGKLMPLAIKALAEVAEGKSISEAVDEYLKGE